MAGFFTNMVGQQGGIDPYFANVVSLLHFDGDFTDVTGKTWVATGTPLIDVSQSMFGGSSMEATGTDRIDCAHADFNFGTDDFTVEIWFRPDATTARPAFSFGVHLVYVVGSNWTYFNGANQRSGGAALLNTWAHIALVRSAGNIFIYADGEVIDGAFSSPGAINPGTMRIGAYNGGNPAGRYYDEFRVTKGVARYTANFTPPIAPFPDS